MRKKLRKHRPAKFVDVRDRSRLKALRLEVGGALLSAVASFVLYLAGCIGLAVLLAAVVVVLIGIIPPQCAGWHERAKRAVRAKWKEKKKWGFHGRDKDVPWVAHIEGPLIVCADCAKDKFFYGEWLIIHNGHIIVNPGHSRLNKLRNRVVYRHHVRRTYAWDGCTPKRSWLWVALVGTPDWWQRKCSVLTVSASGQIKQEEVFWPMTHHASVVHDALYQYLHLIPITPQDVDRLFHQMLKQSGMSPVVANIYYLLVKRCGARDVKKRPQALLSPPRPYSRLLDALDDAAARGLECPGTLRAITRPAKSPLS